LGRTSDSAFVFSSHRDSICSGTHYSIWPGRLADFNRELGAISACGGPALGKALSGPVGLGGSAELRARLKTLVRLEAPRGKGESKCEHTQESPTPCGPSWVNLVDSVVSAMCPISGYSRKRQLGVVGVCVEVILALQTRIRPCLSLSTESTDQLTERETTEP
jgi:hypothetical protein